MAIFNALAITAFLLLLAASAAVVASMIVLALFDLAFGKKGNPPVTTGVTESDAEMMENGDPPSKAETEFANSRPKLEQLAA
jgi:hypothetical protein